ncbi:hypothetical protein GTP41_10265 [Pseudoduganella sp. DS3]|uniref:Uncharacterized protein n=1 Tax=Pseudoduganella guangdongensis TaxID=2692179 RepID=A0A6N9HHB4_9BURK|nr:hypothetical protein [Pseudoduganella guangdongensis]MYN02483.1 hypothetical protein [Pseudoduganella guangdongensis]
MKKLTCAALLLAAAAGQAAPLPAQSRTHSDGRTELDPVDPKAVSEEQRVALGVPRLQDEMARIAAQNKNLQAK